VEEEEGGRGGGGGLMGNKMLEAMFNTIVNLLLPPERNGGGERGGGRMWVCGMCHLMGNWMLVPNFNEGGGELGTQREGGDELGTQRDGAVCLVPKLYIRCRISPSLRARKTEGGGEGGRKEGGKGIPPALW
jgi:hypothetical protein